MLRQPRSGSLVATVFVVLALAGCSTPASRIKASPERFASYPADAQKLIREGKVGLGFDEGMVRMAVGDPDRRWSRVDEEGEKEIWAFTRFKPADDQPYFRGGYYRYHDVAYPYAGYATPTKSEEYFRVVFQAGKVIAVELNTER